jgi:hypothetical protein
MTTTVGDLFLIRTTIFEGFVSHAEVVALV